MPCTPERVWKAIQAGAAVTTEGDRDAQPHFDEGAPNADPAAGLGEGSDQ
jgi:carbon-monoxide dehydrogenase large subunit